MGKPIFLLLLHNTRNGWQGKSIYEVYNVFIN